MVEQQPNQDQYVMLREAVDLFFQEIGYEHWEGKTKRVTAEVTSGARFDLGVTTFQKLKYLLQVLDSSALSDRAKAKLRTMYDVQPDPIVPPPTVRVDSGKPKLRGGLRGKP